MFYKDTPRKGTMPEAHIICGSGIFSVFMQNESASVALHFSFAEQRSFPLVYGRFVTLKQPINVKLQLLPMKISRESRLNRNLLFV